MNKKKTDETKVIRIFEAFAGIGAQRKALDEIEANYKVSGMAEWYIPAIVSYQAIHNNIFHKDNDVGTPLEEMVEFLESKPLSSNSKTPVKKNYWKRKKLNEIRTVYKAVKASEIEGNIFDVNLLYKRLPKDIHILTYSFPCQDLSQQGKGKGMGKNSGTRSGLLWQIEKALLSIPKKNLPKVLVMENVLALNFKKNKPDLDEWIKRLESLGYKNEIQVLNASDFGSAQARRRTFMISALKKKITFPKGNENSRKSINSILDEEIDPTTYLPILDENHDLEHPDFVGVRPTKSNIVKTRLKEYTTFNSEAYVYNPMFTGPTLTASGANSRIKILQNRKIRKLSSSEAYKYMGFDDGDFERVNEMNFLTENKMIFTCGNSISVEVLKAIFSKIIKEMKW